MDETASQSSARAGTKRPHSSLSVVAQDTTKRQKIRHRLRRVQSQPNRTEAASQDPVFAQGQLLKSIGSALVIAGFDGVKPTALEMFRSHVEEYMLRFLSYARFWMQDGRRTQPTAQDFAAALSMMPNSATASLLKSQLSLPIPEAISFPSISEPGPAPPPAPDFSRLLEPLMTARPPAYVPKHFPALPPHHAWVETPVYPAREKDARKMREKATEEGVLAEQALRKLAAAAKTGAIRAERRRAQVLSGAGRSRDSGRDFANRAKSREDTFAEALKDLGESDEMGDVGMDGAAEDMDGGMDLGMPEGVAVNYGMQHWRRGGARKDAL